MNGNTNPKNYVRWRASIQQHVYGLSDFYITADTLLDGRPKPAVVRLTMEPFDEGGLIEEPTFRGQQDEVRIFIQAIVDGAWDAGIRPSGIENYEHELTATKRHLEDMREMVFAQTKGKKP